jgi:peptidoglycan/LPS O-acetylase OafA/YrhL
MNSKSFLTRDECTAMKGIAILGIMLHNYSHWLKGIVRENEYTWLQWKCDKLWEVIMLPDEYLPMHLLSFFGHYGVPVFLFLSGFGLVMKYERDSLPEVGIWRFVRYNYLKLFRILIVGFVLFVMLDAITPGMHRYLASEVLGMLGMYANFFEHPSEVVWPGPYWYFSVTLQLYILYRLVFYQWRHWGVVLVLIVLCWIWQQYCYDDTEMLERLRYNLVGGMLPFGMGVLLARSEKVIVKGEKNGWHQVVALFVLLLSILFTLFFSLFNYHTWLWVPALIVVGTIALVKLIPKVVMPYVLWLGSISAAIFVTHPLVRKIFVRPYLQDDMYAGLLLYIVATLVVSWLVKKIIDLIPSPKL